METLTLHIAAGAVLVTGYLGYQVWQGLLCWLWSERVHAALARAGGPDAPPDKAAAAFPWLEWVSRRLGAEGEGRLDREEALRELDWRLEKEPSYQRLQWTGVVAPLLGVIYTTVGFALWRPPEDWAGKLQEILVPMRPLLLGVGVGASLALVNRCALAWADRRVDQLRQQARDWYDANVWTPPQADRLPAAQPWQEAMLDVVRELLEEVREAVARDRAAGPVDAAAWAELGQAVGGLTGELKALDGSIRDHVVAGQERFLAAMDRLEETSRQTAEKTRSVNETHDQAARQLADLAASACGSLSTLQASAARLQEAVTRHLAPAALAQHDLQAALRENGARVQDLIGEVRDGARVLAAVAQDHYQTQQELAPAYRAVGETLAQLLAINRSLRESVEEVAAGQRDLGRVVVTFSAAAEQLAGSIPSGGGPAARRRDELTRSLEALPGLLAEAARAMQPLGALPGQLREVLDQALNHRWRWWPRFRA